MERTLTIDITNKEGQEVTLFGWVNSYRDHGKISFIDIRDRTGIAQLVVTDGSAKELRDEFVIKVTGKVQKRMPNAINPAIPTGQYVILVSSIEILAKAKTPPFSVTSDGSDIDEEKRLEYRYLDLRRPRMAKNLRARHKMIKFIRDYLDAHDFVEIETPYISKATPEGARDFIVPSRLQPGKFYALPQSPQQYKQLLMLSGFERYYQIARCFRDEDPRADRAYGEFTQLDMELSFTNQEEILNLLEGLYTDLVEKVFNKKIYKKPFPRISFSEAMKKYGADKFDMREDKDPNVLAFAWVVDWPLFEKTVTKEIHRAHHPFTAPKDEDIPLLDTDPMSAHSWQHDLVCNGLEVAGGSIRITDPGVQQKVFKILGHTDEEITHKFGHLLSAFEYGVPPHGGIASGLDRMMSLLMGEPTLREVMAFPMTSGGRTAVMEAPSEVDEKQLRELGISVKKKP